jgi:hypothetical protein
MSEPLKIVLTPVRNEAWVLRAFLEATSLWADYIVIADQMSTDGSREIAKEYSKVILIDNDRKEMHQAATRRLLFEEAKKIEGDKILFALDADEFLAGDFVNSEAWRMIMDSQPNDAFCWRWMNLNGEDRNKCSVGPYYYWAVHTSDDLWDGVFPDNYIHEWRLPWPPQASDDNKHELDGLFSIHLAWVNQNRQHNKERFYQVSTVAKEPKKSKVALFRHYHVEVSQEYSKLPENAYRLYENCGLDVWKYIDLGDEGEYYTSEVLRFFERDGMSNYAMLDIWDEDWMKRNGLIDPRHRLQKMLLAYLRSTNAHANSIWVRCVDKLLKTII